MVKAMPWKKKISTPQEIADEVKLNLEDNTDNARLLILGTETPAGYTMRLSLKNPQAIAGIIYNHAIKTGEVAEALQMCEELVKIGHVADRLIRQKINQQKANN